MSEKTKNFSFAIIPLLLVWMVDRVAKQWAENLQVEVEAGFLKLELVYNHGIMMGWLSHLPYNVKTTLLTTLGAIILSSYLIFITVAPLNSPWLRLGLSILTGGIMGNVSDRLIGQAVIDFIGINYHQSSYIYLNPADIFQWIGYAFIIFGIYQDSQYYWPKQEWRNGIFINTKFQMRIGSFIATIIFLVGFIFLIFGYAFFKHSSENNFALYYFISGFSVLIFLSIIGLITGVTLSHRIAGPVYAIEKYINESLEGKEAPFVLRKSDEFKDLQDNFTKLNIKIRNANKN